MSTVLTINGVVIDRTQYAMTLQGGDLFGRGVTPSFGFTLQAGTLADFPLWDNKPVTVTEAGTLIFSGDTVSHIDHHDPNQLGWSREYRCLGLINRSFRVPVTDSNTLTDTIVYNLTPADGPAYIPSRAGRTVGQIVADVLSMDANAAALSSHGIGNYTSAGTGAAAVANLSGGTVSSCTISSGGSGYSTAPTVIFAGGNPATPATGHATVSGGVVTGVVVDTAGSGYQSTPTIILSRLPSLTLTDLDALSAIPPQRVTIAGERILQALEGVVQVYHPNQWVHVAPDGTIRFYDPRSYTADITLTLDGSDARVPKPTLTRDYSECYQRVQIRGNTLVQPQTFGLQPWPGSSASDGGLQENFAHDGLSNTDAKAKFTAADWNEPGQTSGQATATASISGGAVTGFTVTNRGYNYSSAPSVLISGGGGTGASGTAVLTAGVVTSITLGSGGSGFTSAPTVLLTAPGVGQSVIGTCTMPNTTSVTITPSDQTIQFSADWWDQTSSGHLGQLELYSDAVSGIQQRWYARVTANTSLSPGGTCTLTIDNPAPSTSYTSFQLFGTGGGAGLVYRNYELSDPTVAARVQQVFPYEVPFRRGNGLSEILVTDAQATVFYSSSGNAPYQEIADGVASIDPDGNSFVLSKPTALVFSSNGTSVVPPNDVQLFLPVATGILTSTYPADVGGVPQYAGTSHTVENMSETKYVSCREWRDYGNEANMQLWASEILDALKDTVIEGDVPYQGLLATALTPGHSVNLPGSTYMTGWESINIPIARVSLAYNEGPTGTSYVTTLGLSNRRAMYSGDAFLRPAQVGLPVGLPEGFFSFGGSQEAGEALQQGLDAQASAASRGGLSTGNQTALGATDLSGIATNPADYLRSVGAPMTPLEALGLGGGGGTPNLDTGGES